MDCLPIMSSVACRIDITALDGSTHFAEYVYISRKTSKLIFNIPEPRAPKRTNTHTCHAIWHKQHTKSVKSVKKTTQQKSLTSTTAALAVFCLWIAKVEEDVDQEKISDNMTRLKATLSIHLTKYLYYRPSLERRFRFVCRQNRRRHYQ